MEPEEKEESACGILRSRTIDRWSLYCRTFKGRLLCTRKERLMWAIPRRRSVFRTEKGICVTGAMLANQF